MSEDKYRLVKAVLATGFVIGSLVIAWRIAENGRFVSTPPEGVRPAAVMDTRDGTFRSIVFK